MANHGYMRLSALCMGTAVDGGHQQDTTTALERSNVGGNSREYGQLRPTVPIDVTCAVVDIYGCDDGRIGPTRCAIIDAGLDDRERPCRTCRTPPAAARSGRNALAAGLRPVSTDDPGAFPRSRTRPRSGSTPCDGASPPRDALGTHPSPPHLFLF